MGRWVRKFKLSKISFKQLPSLSAASLPLYEKALKKTKLSWSLAFSKVTMILLKVPISGR